MGQERRQVPFRLQAAYRRQPGRPCHGRRDDRGQRERHKAPCNANRKSRIEAGHPRDGRQRLRLIGEQESAFRHETEKPHHAQGAEEPQADGTGEGRKQSRKQAALCRGKDVRLDAQVVRGRCCKICRIG